MSAQGYYGEGQQGASQAEGAATERSFGQPQYGNEQSNDMSQGQYKPAGGYEGQNQSGAGYGGGQQHMQQNGYPQGQQQGEYGQGQQQGGYGQGQQQGKYNPGQQGGYSQAHQQDGYSQGQQQGGYGQGQQQEGYSGGQQGQQGQQQGNHYSNGANPATHQPDGQKKDQLTILLEKLEKKFGGERFTNPDNEAKNKAMNENIIKKLTYAVKLLMQKAPGYAMRYLR